MDPDFGFIIINFNLLNLKFNCKFIFDLIGVLGNNNMTKWRQNENSEKYNNLRDEGTAKII